MLRGLRNFCVSLIAFTLSLPVYADPVDTRYLDLRLQLLMKRDDMMGLAVGVVEDGRVSFLRGYGYTESGGVPVTEDTVFRWASVSKGLAGSVAAKLASEGVLSLDARLSDYNTHLRLPGYGERRASIRDLLAHRLGLEARANNRELETGIRPDNLRNTLSSARTVCRISTCHSYQNVAFDTITEILEKATGKSYDDLVREKVFRPLGMNSATTTYNGLVASGSYALPHSWSQSSKRLYRDGITLPYFEIPSAAGVSSSVRDMTRFMQSQFGTYPGVFHSESLIEAQTWLVKTPVTETKMHALFPGIETAGYGLGWRIYKYRGHKLVGHEGIVRGMRASMLFDPDLRSGVVLVWNSGVSRPMGLQFEVMDMIYGEPKRDWMRIVSDPRG